MKKLTFLAITLLVLIISCTKQNETKYSSKIIWDPFLEVSIGINKGGISTYKIKDPEDSSKLLHCIDLKMGDEVVIYNADSNNIRVIELNEGRLVQQIDTLKTKQFISGENKIYKLKTPPKFKIRLIKEKINWDSLKVKFPTIFKFK